MVCVCSAGDVSSHRKTIVSSRIRWADVDRGWAWHEDGREIRSESRIHVLCPPAIAIEIESIFTHLQHGKSTRCWPENALQHAEGADLQEQEVAPLLLLGGRNDDDKKLVAASAPSR